MLTTLINTSKLIPILFFVSNICTTVCQGKTFYDFSQEKNDIKLSVHALSNTEMRTLFNCYNPVKITRLTSYYKAIEITVENRTAQEYLLAQNNIELQLENTLIIKRKVITNPIIVPTITTLATSAALILGIGFAAIPSVFFSAALGITTLNLNMQQSNNFSIKNIRTKVLDAQHPALLPSFSKIQKIVFVASKNMRKQFPISLESIDRSQKISFEISLKKP